MICNLTNTRHLSKVKFATCFEVIIQALYMVANIYFWFHIIVIVARQVRIYSDNYVIVFFSKNDKYLKGEKHMDLKYLSVKEELHKQNVSIEHIVQT